MSLFLLIHSKRDILQIHSNLPLFLVNLTLNTLLAHTPFFITKQTIGYKLLYSQYLTHPWKITFDMTRQNYLLKRVGPIKFSYLLFVCKSYWSAQIRNEVIDFVSLGVC